jgi:alanine dehydrogenase
VKSLSEIAGTASVLIAAELMINNNDGKGLLFGNITGVPPTEVVILGAGTVAEYAVRTALSLGANVKVFDNSITKLRRLQNTLNQRIFTSTIHDKALLKAIRRCDVAIGALRGKNRTPIVVTETMVEHMKKGAVIVDVSIDTGGCFETSEITTHENPTFVVDGVVHYCVANMPGAVARTSTYALTNVTLKYARMIAKEGVDRAIMKDKPLRLGVNIYKGKLVYEAVARDLDLPFTPLALDKYL